MCVCVFVFMHSNSSNRFMQIKIPVHIKCDIARQQHSDETKRKNTFRHRQSSVYKVIHRAQLEKPLKIHDNLCGVQKSKPNPRNMHVLPEFFLLFITVVTCDWSCFVLRIAYASKITRAGNILYAWCYILAVCEDASGISISDSLIYCASIRSILVWILSVRSIGNFQCESQISKLIIWQPLLHLHSKHLHNNRFYTFLPMNFIISKQTIGNFCPQIASTQYKYDVWKYGRWTAFAFDFEYEWIINYWPMHTHIFYNLKHIFSLFLSHYLSVRLSLSLSQRLN